MEPNMCTENNDQYKTGHSSKCSSDQDLDNREVQFEDTIQDWDEDTEIDSVYGPQKLLYGLKELQPEFKAKEP